MSKLPRIIVSDLELGDLVRARKYVSPGVMEDVWTPVTKIDRGATASYITTEVGGRIRPRNDKAIVARKPEREHDTRPNHWCDACGGAHNRTEPTDPHGEWIDSATADSLLEACEAVFMNGMADDTFGDVDELGIHAYRVGHVIVTTDTQGFKAAAAYADEAEATRTFELLSADYQGANDSDPDERPDPMGGVILDDPQGGQPCPHASHWRHCDICNPTVGSDIGPALADELTTIGRAIAEAPDSTFASPNRAAPDSLEDGTVNVAATWDARIASAASTAEAQDTLEAAVAAGVPLTALLDAQAARYDAQGAERSIDRLGHDNATIDHRLVENITDETVTVHTLAEAMLAWGASVYRKVITRDEFTALHRTARADHPRIYDEALALAAELGIARLQSQWTAHARQAGGQA